VDVPGQVASRARSPARRNARALGLLVAAAVALWAGRAVWSAVAPRAAVLAVDAPAGGAAPQLQAEPTAYAGHVAAVNGLALSLDGTLIASGSDDLTIDLRETESGLLRRTLRGPELAVLGVAFSPDGRRVAAASGEMIWGKPDGVRVFDRDTGVVLAHLADATSASASVAWSGDGRFLAAGTGCAVGSCETVIHLWDGATLEHRARLMGHDGAIGGLAFAPDSLRLASASADASVRIWDPQTGAELSRLLGHDAPVICVAFDATGTRLASGGGHPLTGAANHVLLWDLAAGERQLTLAGHESTVFGVAFSPDGTLIASVSGAAVALPGGLRKPDASLRLWDAASGEPLSVRPVVSASDTLLEGLWAVAFTADGTAILAAADDGRILKWTLTPADGPAAAPTGR
jgi:WD40 repeat protein